MAHDITKIELFRVWLIQEKFLVLCNVLKKKKELLYLIMFTILYSHLEEFDNTHHDKIILYIYVNIIRRVV